MAIVLAFAEAAGDEKFLRRVENGVHDAGTTPNQLRRWLREQIERHGHDWVLEAVGGPATGPDWRSRLR
jgi:hypothetical protein